MRHISRFYLLAIREEARRQLFLARLQGWDGSDPDWLEDREPAPDPPPPPSLSAGSLRVLVPGPDGARYIAPDDPLHSRFR